MHATRLNCASGSAHRRPVPHGWHLPGWLVLLVAVLGCGPGSAPQEMPEQIPPVAVAAVQEREVTVEQTYVGTVTPLRISTVSSPVEGLVVEFLVNEGDYVQGKSQRALLRGQESPEPQDGPKTLPLARLRTESLAIQIAAAKAELNVRQAELSELRASQPKEIDQAQKKMLAAEALKMLTQSRLKRTRELRERGVATPDELEEQESAAEGAANVYLEKKAAWELLVETDYWEEKIKQAQARVQVQQDTIDGLEDDLTQHEIYAPFDGYVTKEHVEVGEWVAKGSPIAEVVELDYVDIEVPVLESYVARLRQPALLFRFELDAAGDLREGALLDALREHFTAQGISLSEQAAIRTEEEGRRWSLTDQGQTYTVAKGDTWEVYRPGTPARVEIGALPGRDFHGEVTAIVPQADVRSRSFPVRVRLRNPESPQNPNDVALKPGMFARVTLPAGKKSMVLVPKDALVLGGTSRMVWVVTPDAEDKALGKGKVKSVQVDVDLGSSENRWIEVLGPLDEDQSLPLEPGQLVIVEGNERIRGGTVRITKTVPPDADVSGAPRAGLDRSDPDSGG